MSTTISQRQQLSIGAAIKAPVAVAVGTPITLSGAQTVGGVAVGPTTPATRVLVYGQPSTVQNGIYDVQNGAWTLSLDSCGVGDFVPGTVGMISGGSYANQWWILTSPADSSGWVIPGTDGMTFQVGIPLLGILSASSGATNIGTLNPGASAVAVALSQWMAWSAWSIFNFMSAAMIADIQSNAPVLDHTTQINTANTSATLFGKTLWWGPGTYQATNIPLIAGQKWVGESKKSVILKCKSGTNTNFITSATNVIDDVHIEGMTINGNFAGNSSGDTLNIDGSSPTLKDLIILNSPGTALQTNYNTAEGERTAGMLGYFSNIIIDSPQHHGWLHNGPNDSYFSKIEIIDAGLATNNTYYGFNDEGSSGNGRFFDVHVWNRSETTNVPITAFNCSTPGNTFSGCHFEGGMLPLNIAYGGNIFADCAAYATRGTYCVSVGSEGNTIQMLLGLVASSANPNYKGIYLGSSNNIIDVANSGVGCTLGAVDFSGDTGQNIVRIVGNQTTGPAYAGTPNATTEVSVMVTGGGTLGTFRQYPGIAWTSYTPTITSGTGAFTTVAATGIYTLIGKTCHWSVTVTDTTNGTAAGAMLISLPFTSVAGKSFIASGRASVVSGAMLVGTIGGGSTTCSVFTYNNQFPGSTGETMIVSGTFETA